MKRFRDIFGKSLGERSGESFEQCLYDALHSARGEPALLHVFSGRIVRLHAHIVECQFADLVNLRMGYLISAAVDGRFAKDNVFSILGIILIYVFRPVEPHEVDHSVAIGELGNDAFLPRSHRHLLEAKYSSFQLHIGHLALELVGGEDVSAVDVLVGIIFEQVAPCGDIELFVQYLLTRRTNPGQVLQVLRENVGQLC